MRTPTPCRLLAGPMLALVLLAPMGACVSKRGAPRASETDRLRADSDRAFAEIEPERGGKPVPARPRDDQEGLPKPPALDRSKARPQPEWVATGSSPAYAISQYILGVGSARKPRSGSDSAALATAEGRARGGVAKNIRVHIQAEFRSAAHLITESATGETVVKKDASTIQDQISSRADIMLEGVEIVDRWYDQSTDTYWAFAALHRPAAVATILDRMDALRQRMEQDYEMGVGLRKRGSAFRALRHLGRALHSAFGLLNYRSQLRVISPNHADDERADVSDVNVGTLWREAALARQELRVGMVLFIEVDGTRSTSWQAEAELSRTLRTIGFNTVKLSPPKDASYADLTKRKIPELCNWVGQDANSLVLARVESCKVGSEKLVKLLIHFYQARGELQILDLSEGQVIATAGFDFSPGTHTGDKNPARAAEAALLLAAKELGKYLERELSADLALME